MPTHHSSQGGRVTGLIIAFIGLLFLLDHFNILGLGSVIGTWWPLILIVVGAYKYGDGDRTGSLILLGLGAVFLLANLNIIRWGSIFGLWPIILIVLGLGMAFGRQNYFGYSSKELDTEEISVKAILAGNARRVTSANFRGGEVVAIMGGVELDLRETTPAEDCQLRINTVMGGAEIRVPEDWQIIISGTPVLSGIEDRTRQTGADGPVVRVSCSAIMGGIEIRN